MPAVSNRSLCAIGMPSSGDVGPLAMIRASAARASAKARSAVTVMKAATDGFSWSMSARYAFVSSTGDSVFRAISRLASAIVIGSISARPA